MSRPLLTVNEVGQRVGLGHLAIRRAINRDELPAVKLCERIRVDPDDVDKWIQARRVKGNGRS